MAEVTTMVIKVDLDCEKCHKKIKKVLCQISEIQNQVYDKKANTVTITVVCCSPEKIKKKICCKGGKAIKGIEIKVPKAPEPPKQVKSVPVVVDPPSKPKVIEPPRNCCRECYRGFDWGPCYTGHDRAAPAPVLPCYDPCYGWPVYDSWGGGGGCPCQRGGYYVCRCEFVRDDSQSTCGIM